MSPHSRVSTAFVCTSTVLVAMFAALSVPLFARQSPEVVYYSTAAPPGDYPGPAPTKGETPLPARLKAKIKVEPPSSPDPIAEAKSAIEVCSRTFAGVNDYTCLFYKRERVEGKLSAVHAMQMKARTNPQAYDWPKNGRAPELVEEYTYSDLKLNVGLTAKDFDTNNKTYAFGRF